MPLTVLAALLHRADQISGVDRGLDAVRAGLSRVGTETGSNLGDVGPEIHEIAFGLIPDEAVADDRLAVEGDRLGSDPESRRDLGRGFEADVRSVGVGVVAASDK